MRLYIDEIGALRRRPRNARAEALAARAGLAGLAIHGDAFVGRCAAARDGGGERNVDFDLDELSPDAAWARAAFARHAAAGAGDAELLGGGEDAAAGWAWTQTDDELEVRVRGAPAADAARGAAKKRVAVSYGRGDALEVKVDGEVRACLRPLFARVAPDGCAWTLDGDEIVVTMEKEEARPWASLTLSGNAQ